VGKLPELYPGEDAANATAREQLAEKSLTHDYFPHGGVIGAGYIDVPRALAEAPPQELATLLDPSKNVLTRLTAGLTYVNDYLLKNTIWASSHFIFRA